MVCWVAARSAAAGCVADTLDLIAAASLFDPAEWLRVFFFVCFSMFASLSKLYCLATQVLRCHADSSFLYHRGTVLVGGG
jgi:hypothetical protein